MKNLNKKLAIDANNKAAFSFGLKISRAIILNKICIEYLLNKSRGIYSKFKRGI